jgi:uncharacterized repeat protein (TIGR01451 family)
VFLARAYTEEARRTELRRYLDRPWGLGDLYYLQKLVATIEAGGQPDFSSSTKRASTPLPASGETITYSIVLRNSGNPLTSTVFLTDDIPAGLSYVPESVSASLGDADYDNGSILWSEIISATPTVTIGYAVMVEEAEEPMAIKNTATIDAGDYGVFECSTTVIVDGYPAYLPIILRH